MQWKAWITWDRIAAQEMRLASLGAEIPTPIFECALTEPWKYSTKAHALADDETRTLCGRKVPEHDPDTVAIWTGPEEGVAKCKRCQKKVLALPNRSP